LKNPTQIVNETLASLLSNAGYTVQAPETEEVTPEVPQQQEPPQQQQFVTPQAATNVVPQQQFVAPTNEVTTPQNTNVQTEQQPQVIVFNNPTPATATPTVATMDYSDESLDMLSKDEMVQLWKTPEGKKLLDGKIAEAFNNFNKHNNLIGWK